MSFELALNEMTVDGGTLDSAAGTLVSGEVFFTGTAVEVAPIVPIDHRPVGTCEIGPVTAKLRSLYEDATHGCMPADRRWLWPVAAGKVA